MPVGLEIALVKFMKHIFADFGTNYLEIFTRTSAGKYVCGKNTSLLKIDLTTNAWLNVCSKLPEELLFQ